MEKLFEYVCRKCGWMARHRMELLRPGESFQCPYCRSVFGLIDNRIQVLSKKVVVGLLPAHTHPE